MIIEQRQSMFRTGYLSCGAYAIEIPNSVEADIEELKRLMKEEHAAIKQK